jgi:long-chain acyl-CoA synthetase
MQQKSSCTAYGMTETSPVATHGIKGTSSYKTVGPPISNTDMKIVHVERGTNLTPGEMGEICVRGPQVSSKSFRSSKCHTHKILSSSTFRISFSGLIGRR